MLLLIANRLIISLHQLSDCLIFLTVALGLLLLLLAQLLHLRGGQRLVDLRLREAVVRDRVHVPGAQLKKK